MLRPHPEHAMRRARAWIAAPIAAVLALGLTAAASTAQPTLEEAVHASSRSPRFVARDGARHPVEELRFFGVTPRSKVVEIWPGGDPTAAARERPGA